MTATDVTAVRPVQPAAAAPEAAGPTATATASLHLLTPAALLILLISVLLLVFGPSEALETRQWILAFCVALPGGILIAGRQARGLDDARAAWAVAAGAVALFLGLALRYTGVGDGPAHGLLALAAAATIAAPWLVRRVTPGSAVAGHTTTMVTLVVATVMFIPDGALRGARLLPALTLAGVVLIMLLVSSGWAAPPRLRHAVDLALAATLSLIVMSVPDIRTSGYVLVHHQDFYLGPVNAMANGRPMLDGTWSQYGVGVMDALRLMFAVVPFGYGGLSLLVGVLTAAQYALVYMTLRLSIRSQLLIVAIIGAEVVVHILGQGGSYLAVPSTSPLRFGLPYVLIALAVLAARYPARARVMRAAQLVVLAISAVWSFETLVYTASTLALIVTCGELATGPGAVRRIARTAAGAGTVVIAALLAYAGLRIALSGGADWGPYLDYLRLYSVDGFGQLPIIIFSPGPVMGAVIFLSIAGTIHLARIRSPAASAPQLAALAGFGGAAAGIYTYYLGRSYPGNLLHILLPVMALGGLWAAVLLQAPRSPARLAALGALLTAAAMLAVMGWPLAKGTWRQTAFAQAVPSADGGSLTYALRRLWRQPVFDPRSTSAVAMLDEHLRPGAPALVLTEPDLTTEILIRGHRRNLLPISHPLADDLLDSNDSRVRAAAQDVPAGTLMLTTPPPKVPGQTGTLGGNPLDFVGVQVVALDVLHERFAFHRVDETPDGLLLVRLQPRRSGDGRPAKLSQRATGRSTP